jgi:hypothetical protein
MNAYYHVLIDQLPGEGGTGDPSSVLVNALDSRAYWRSGSGGEGRL